MPHQHLIRWLADGSTEWLSTSREGAVLQGPSPGLPSAPAERVVMILPAEDVLLLRAPRVARNPQQLAKALPFAIEESLAGPVEQQHVAFADSEQADQVAVAVIARERLQHCIEQLRVAGLSADQAWSELQCLPWQGDRPTWLHDASRLLLRSGANAGLVLAADDLLRLNDWLQRDIDPSAPPKQYRSGEQPDAAEPIGRPLLAWLAQHLPQAATPNLLQGEFAPPQRRAAARSQWRWAAILAAAALLIGLGGAYGERLMLERYVQQRQQEMEQLLRQALPEVQRVVDPVAQLRAALSTRGSSGADALNLLNRIAPVLGSGGSITLDAIDYRAGVLELTVLTPDVASLDSLRERLASLALQVELTAATPGSRGVEGRLRLQGGGA